MPAHISAWEKVLLPVSVIRASRKTHSFVTPLEVLRAAEKTRQSRQNKAINYTNYRKYIERYEPNSEKEKRSGKKVLPQDRNLHPVSDHEWNLYLKAGTAFDLLIRDGLSQGMSVWFIKNQTGHGLKRIEMQRPNNGRVHVLWTAVGGQTRDPDARYDQFGLQRQSRSGESEDVSDASAEDNEQRIENGGWSD